MPKQNKPREWTREEVKEKFLKYVAGLVDYWDKVPDAGDQLKRIEGIAFSILVALDGGSTALPGFTVAPHPHPSDKQYSIEQGENYYHRSPRPACDIAGYLHEEFHPMLRTLRGE